MPPLATPPAEVKVEAPAEVKPATPEVPVVAAFAPPTRPPGPAGAVYFAIADRGVVRLVDGKFTLLGNSPTQLVKGL